jgi:hypothetical protein
MASGAFAPSSPGGTRAQGRDFIAPEIDRVEHAEGSGASNVKAWTAGGLRTAAASTLPLPPVQFELFTEAGAVVAARLARDGATEATLASVLRRAADQAGSLVPLQLSPSPAGEGVPNGRPRRLTDRGEPR